MMGYYQNTNSLLCTRCLVSMDSCPVDQSVTWQPTLPAFNHFHTQWQKEYRDGHRWPRRKQFVWDWASHSVAAHIKTKLYCPVSVYSIITRGFMPLLSLSFALSAQFLHSLVSLQKCLLPAHLAQQGKQIRMAYAAVTGRSPQMSVLGRAVKQWSNPVTHYFIHTLLKLHTHRHGGYGHTDTKMYLKFTLTPTSLFKLKKKQKKTPCGQNYNILW